MYKEYLVIAEKPDRSDTKVYWDSTEAEAIADIRRLRDAGYDVDGYRETVTETFSHESGRFLHV